MGELEYRSFDIFDTLLARRCVRPHDIFRFVEAKAEYRGFTEMRIAAEAELYKKGEYGLDDIYGELIVSFGLTDVDASRLKALELAEEYDNLVPIRQHIVEVQPGDLLISDMYLPKSFITRLVREKCKLHFNPIFVSSHGKQTGHVWRALTKALQLLEHTGNSQHADVTMPDRFGVKTRHTTAWQMTPNEALVELLGYRGLAQAVRTARLALWSPHSDEQMLGCAQIDVNFPFLFLTALHLINLATINGWERLLFSSRDCFLLSLIFRRIINRLNLQIESTYFFTSRVARVTPTGSYLKYFSDLCGTRRSVVVDLCGTGWSLTRLFEIAGKPGMEMFLVHHMRTPDILDHYREIVDISHEPIATSITKSGHNGVLEALNATDHPMVIDVIEVDNVFVPSFLRVPNPKRHDELIRFSHQAFMLALDSTEKISTDELAGWLSAVQGAHIKRIYHRAMFELAEVTSELRAQLRSENGPVEALIRDRLALPGTSVLGG